MTETETTVTNENEQTKTTPKYYTEKNKEYMRRYRAKKGTYTDAQKQSIYKYNARIKEEAKQYRELMKKGLIPISVN